MNVTSYRFMKNIHINDDPADNFREQWSTADFDESHCQPDDYYPNQWKMTKRRKANERKYDEISREQRRAKARNGVRKKVILNKHGREHRAGEVPILDENREFIRKDAWAKIEEDKAVLKKIALDGKIKEAKIRELKALAKEERLKAKLLRMQGIRQQPGPMMTVWAD